MDKKSWLISVFCMTCCLPGCGDEQEEGEGTLRLELWGEEYIEEGIPADAFADGYSVTFDKFLINLGEISAAREGDAPSIELEAMRVWDLTREGPFPLASQTVAAGAYRHSAYTIARAGSDSSAGNATPADLEQMRDNQYSVYAAGEATDGTTTKSFAWGFTTEKRYDPCHSEAELVDGGEASIQITIHGDHLFYDDAVGSDPAVRFADLALADADQDGEITFAELEGYSIAALPNYLVGSLDIDNLRDFVSHMTATLGHIDGEGHCE